MTSKFLNIILFLQVSLTFSQENVLSPKEATRIINSGKYEINESIEHDLDTIGTQIIRQLFYEKANYPERISKKEYLERFSSSSFEKRNVSLIYKSLKKPEFRKRVYTLRDEDSVLIYGSKDIWYNYNNRRKGVKDLWRIYPIDTSITPNPYYSFFKFEITLGSNFIPMYIANGIISRASSSSPTEYSIKYGAAIYDSRFLVGVPKVNLRNKNNEKVELPLLLLGKDFVSYPKDLLLTTVLNTSDYSDGIASLVHLYTYYKYGASMQQLHEIPCRKLNLFRSKKCYKFSVLNRRYQKGNLKDTIEYIATINKSLDIKYKLVEEPQNLIPFVRKTCKEFYEQYGINNNNTLKINFISKRGRKFIYEAEWSRSGLGYLRSSESYEHLRTRVTYKKGKVSCSKKIKVK